MSLTDFKRFTSFTKQTWIKIQRTKSIGNPSDGLSDTQLQRCLSTIDITLLGIGHMVGSGAYVLTSSIAKNVAGPAIVLSYIISGFAAFLCALCYAEFSSRFPKCGSAYSYAYIALGEIWAFVVGWNMILENVIGIAAVSRASSAYLDSTIGGEIRNYTNSWISPILSESLASHIDILAGLITIGFTFFLTTGMKVTTYINNTFSIINMVAIIIIIVVGAYFSDFSNWTNVKGGFMPYGWKGVFAGSASCFYAYIGFDSIATSGEEARDPQRSIPIATFVAMIVASISYVGVSSAMTLMYPYDQISEESGLPDALGAHGAMWAKFAVIIGACCGMATVLIGTIYSLTRIVYAMADDGLLFPWMSYVNSKSQIPLMGMFFFTGFGVLLSIFMDITTLVEMMSIGTLIAYLVVSASIIVLRYRKPNVIQLTIDGDDDDDDQQQFSKDENDDEEQLFADNEQDFSTWRSTIKTIFNKKLIMETLRGYFQDSLISFCVFAIVVLTIFFCLICKLFQKNIDETLLVFLLSLITTLLCLIIAIIYMHKPNKETLRYKVPFVPIIPLLSIFFNVSLIVNLNWLTWMRFIVWMTIGMKMPQIIILMKLKLRCLIRFLIYFCYGIKSSKAEYNTEIGERINVENIKKWNSFDSNQNEDILMTRDN
ncbi:cationic amino acid transporter 4-like protein [Sarcoptes scabiei]|uniref:Cationic amino acid transporter 4-like protein n=1 Tax=Sarcoptes scabiei TaxID=52283 RepID=A0A132A8A9_SARSC|nr:cationic amino acid transporter 4-like protein [Sarcoptes scabiei]